MNVNPLQLIQLIKNGMNPQQLIMNILQQPNNKNNPILQNAAALMQNGDKNGLETLARNLAQQRGIDFDQAYNKFKGYFY